MTDSAKGFEDAFTAAAESLADGITQDFKPRSTATPRAKVTVNRGTSSELKETPREIVRGSEARRTNVASVCGCTA